MKGINSSVIIKQVAKQLNLPQEDVDVIVTEYYKHVQSMLRSLEHKSVYLYKIGKFRVLSKRLVNKILKYEHKIEVYNKNTLKDYAIREETKRELVKLYELKKKLAEKYNKKNVIRKKRKEYESNFNMEREE